MKRLKKIAMSKPAEQIIHYLQYEEEVFPDIENIVYDFDVYDFINKGWIEVEFDAGSPQSWDSPGEPAFITIEDFDMEKILKLCIRETINDVFDFDFYDEKIVITDEIIDELYQYIIDQNGGIKQSGYIIDDLLEESIDLDYYYDNYVDIGPDPDAAFESYYDR